VASGVVVSTAVLLVARIHINQFLSVWGASDISMASSTPIRGVVVAGYTAQPHILVYEEHQRSNGTKRERQAWLALSGVLFSVNDFERRNCYLL